jgi:hypothetical protein
MPLPNHIKAFRPLRAGTYVLNPAAAEPGTLGWFATSNGADRWLVSCCHVLCRPNLGPSVAGEPVFQPTSDAPIVANVQLGDITLDVAAALILPAVAIALEILNLPPIQAPAQPQVGMRVIKSGMATGVTEGIITAVNAATSQVEIELVSGFHPDYELSAAGDSGAVWLTRASCQPVALHTGLKLSGAAAAVSWLDALAALNLQPI